MTSITALSSTHKNYVLFCNASSIPMDINEMSVRLSVCVISKLSIDPTLDFPMHMITLVTAVNMRDTCQVSLMPKQAAAVPINITLDLSCTLFCLYRTHLFTLAFVYMLYKGMDNNHGAYMEVRENIDLNGS